MNFAFPNAKVDWRPRVVTEQQKQDKRVAELIAELRLYHHYEAAKELERLHAAEVASRPRLPKECSCEEVVRRLVRCQIMGEDDECLMCRSCDLHFHAPKGTRKFVQENPMPWTPPKPAKTHGVR